jgi:hypothetical protein
MENNKSNKQSHSPNRNSNKGDKGDWHVSHSSMGMGDYYGTGIRAKIGTMIEGTGMQEIPKNKLKTPPTSVV